MRFVRALLVMLILFFGWMVGTNKIFAQENAFVTIVNPVRGNEFWSFKDQLPVTSVAQSYQIIAQKGLPATWLLRYDALSDSQIVSAVKSMNQNQEIGLFFEVTPTLAQAAGVSYQQSSSWHNAGSLFLTGYSQDDRIKLIDTLVGKYREVFGRDPQSAGAWWIDAYSLNYLKTQYHITCAMIVSDQYTTDNYQIWGQYWSVPYMPSKTNTLMPAETPDNSLGVPIIQWAPRDPYNAYGNSVYESTYSVQANDYQSQYHSFGVDYFTKLLTLYLSQSNKINQVTVGLENDFSWKKFGPEYQKQLSVVADRVQNGTATAVTMTDFGRRFLLQNGLSNGISVVVAKNPLGGSGQVVWYLSPYYRVGWFYTDKGSVIRDMRLYFDSKEEPCFKSPCATLNFAYTDSKALDEVTFGDRWVIDEGDISGITQIRQGDTLTISYANKAGIKRTIAFSPHDISIDGHATAASAAIINAIAQNEKTNQPVAAANEPHQLPWSRLLYGAIVFVITVFFLLYLPGRVIVKKLLGENLAGIWQWPIDIVVGIVLLTTLGYVLSLIHLGSMTILPIGLLSLYGLLHYRLPKISREQLVAHAVPIGLITLGTVIISLTQIKNGLPFSYGLGFWGANGHDAIWHLALIEQLIKQIPPHNPAFAGTTLTNYHYFFDVFVAQIAIWTRLNTIDLLFRFVPLLLATLFGCLLYGLIWHLSHSKLAGALGLIFGYTAGSFGWLITLVRIKHIGGESLFWSMQSPSILLNPPFAISVVILLAGTIILMTNAQLTARRLILIALLWCTLAEFKIYAAILAIGALGLTAIVQYLRTRERQFLNLTLILVITNAVFVILNTAKPQGLLAFSPFWLINTMLEAPDRLFWPRLVLTRNSGNMIKFDAAEVIGLLVFLIGNFGFRAIGLFDLSQVRAIRKITWPHLFLVSLATIGTVIPILFIQKPTPWNIVQFFYYALIILDIYAALTLARLLSRFSGPIKIVSLVVLGLAIAVPSCIATLQDYLPYNAPARLSYGELDALQFLHEQPDGVVLTYPFSEKDNAKWLAPKPLFAYTSTAYVSGFSGKPVFLEDLINNAIIGQDTTAREVTEQEIFRNQDPGFVQDFLKANNISYIYLPTALKSHLDEGTYGAKRIYSTKDVTIYKVK